MAKMPVGIVPTVQINHGVTPVGVASDMPTTNPQPVPPSTIAAIKELSGLYPPAVGVTFDQAPRQSRITWSPIGTETNVPFSGSSYLEVRKALVAVFGTFPIALRNPDHLIVLQAMQAAAGDGGVAYATLHRALANLPGIELKDF